MARVLSEVWRNLSCVAYLVLTPFLVWFTPTPSSWSLPERLYHYICRHGMDLDYRIQRLGLNTLGFVLKTFYLKSYEYVSLPQLRIRGYWVGEASRNPATTKLIFFVHGGGFVLGHPLHASPFYAALQEEFQRLTSSQMRVFALHYRFAPEFPFPAALDDVKRTYKWLLAEGYQAQNICLMGDSAGGNLSLKFVISQLQERPQCLVLLCPVLDLTKEEYHETRNDILTSDFLTRVKDLYIPRHERIAASPGLHAVPADCPMLLIVGEEELLLEENVAYYNKCQANELPVQLRIQPEAYHDYFTTFFPSRQTAIDQTLEFLQQQFQSQLH